MNHDTSFSKTAYDQSTGYAVKGIPLQLFQLIDELVSIHLDINPSIGSRLPADYQLLLESLNNSAFNSRQSRTLPVNTCRSVSAEIIHQLATIMPKPKRLHNHDIYCRVVMASKEQTTSIPHRDEYFHRISPGWEFAEDEESIKVWIPLFCPSEIALGVIPGSHVDYSHGNAIYKIDIDHPRFEAPHKTSDLTPVRVGIKQCLVFPSMLIHGSLSAQHLDPLRISVELSPVLSK